MKFEYHYVICILLVASVCGLSQKPVDMIYENRLIYVKMLINGEFEETFLLDTGASTSAIDLATAMSLGLTISGKDHVEGTAGRIEVQRVTLDGLSIGTARVKDLKVTTYNLTGLLIPRGQQRVAGILGFDFLRQFVLKIDYIDRKITFESPPVKAASRGSDMLVMPFTLDNGIPRFSAVLDRSINTSFRLDTGASLFASEDVYLNVTEDIWGKLKSKNRSLVPETHFTGSGVGGTVRLPVARVGSVAFGKVAIVKPYVIVQPRAGYFSRPEAVGFVSNNLLEKFRVVTIDYINQQLIIRKQPIWLGRRREVSRDKGDYLARKDQTVWDRGRGLRQKTPEKRGALLSIISNNRRKAWSRYANAEYLLQK
ncbi:MAG: retropepsin-like aspartic protease [Pyrinomonadaceae bacterium]